MRQTTWSPTEKMESCPSPRSKPQRISPSACSFQRMSSWSGCPAYSPELNPVERLWEDLKARIDVMDVRVRSSLSALQEHVAEIVQRSSAEIIAWLSGYAYLREVGHALEFSGYGTIPNIPMRSLSGLWPAAVLTRNAGELMISPVLQSCATVKGDSLCVKCMGLGTFAMSMSRGGANSPRGSRFKNARG